MLCESFITLRQSTVANLTQNHLYDENEERLLTAKVAAGDDAAFTELYRIYRPILGQILTPFSQDMETDELIQDIFYRVWIKRDLLTAVTSFRNYIIRVARNRVLDKLRANKIRSGYARRIQVDNPVIEEADLPLYKELNEHVWKAIEALPERQKKIFTLFFLQDWSRAEIAEHFALSIFTIDKEIGLASRAIRSIIDRY